MDKLVFQDWKTGKEKEYILGKFLSINKHEKITNFICPLDKTPLIEQWEDEYASKIFCVNCGTNYGYNHPKNNQEEINKKAKYNLKRDKENLEELNKKRKSLILRIKRAEEVFL